MKKRFAIITLMVIAIVLVVVWNKTGTEAGTTFCGRKLVGVPEWLDISEPEGGLAPGATASGLLAIRAQQYIQKHDSIESFEITEATGETFMSYDEEGQCIESADNGGAHIMIRQKLLNESIAKTAMTLERSKDTDRSKVETIYASLADSDEYTDYSVWCFEPRQSVDRKPDALNYNMKEDEHLCAWTKQGATLQACYGGFVYVSGREDPVCVMARNMVSATIADTITALASDLKERDSNIPERYLAYCNGIIARENPKNGQMEVCPWYASTMAWEGKNYYPKLGNKRRDSFVFVPEGTSELAYGDKSILANQDGFQLVEYDRINNEWYIRCQLTGAGSCTAIYGDEEVNVVVYKNGLFVVSPTKISLIEGLHIISVEDEIYVYNEKTMKSLTLNRKYTGDTWRLTKEAVEEIKTGDMLGHKLKSILEFSQGDPTKLDFPTETAEVFIMRADGMNKEEWPYNNEHAEVRVTIDELSLRWSTLEY